MGHSCDRIDRTGENPRRDEGGTKAGRPRRDDDEGGVVVG
jgi:hypothetical protein